jgi:hypothetical protein
MNQSHEDKRRESRYTYGRPVTYMGVVGISGYPPKEVPLTGTIVDLSNSGVGIETKGYAFLEPGAVVQTWIPMSDIPVSIPVMTRVQWVRDKSPGPSQLVGLQFLW